MKRTKKRIQNDTMIEDYKIWYYVPLRFLLPTPLLQEGDGSFSRGAVEELTCSYRRATNVVRQRREAFRAALTDK